MSQKLLGYLKCVVNPHGTVNYELNVSHFWHSTYTGARKHAGMLPKNLDESVGLTRSFSRTRVLRALREDGRIEMQFNTNIYKYQLLFHWSVAHPVL